MNKLAVSIVVAAVIGCVVGYAIGYSIGGKNVAASYAEKIAAVGKLFPAPAQTLSLNGQVKSVTRDAITIDVTTSAANPFTEGDAPLTREVTVTETTAIVRMEQKDPAIFQKEMTDFQKATKDSIASAKNAPVAITPPSPFGEKSIKLADIKVGDMVTVTAESDIANAESFSATKIQAMMTATAVPAANQTAPSVTE